MRLVKIFDTYYLFQNKQKVFPLDFSKLEKWLALNCSPKNIEIKSTVMDICRTFGDEIISQKVKLKFLRKMVKRLKKGGYNFYDA